MGGPSQKVECSLDMDTWLARLGPEQDL
eukprot:SAG22_NODE_15942_length_336_cov_0.873418_1_plen_27_part_10